MLRFTSPKYEPRKQLFPPGLQVLILITDTAGPQLPGHRVTNFHFTHILRKIDDFLPFYYTW